MDKNLIREAYFNFNLNHQLSNGDQTLILRSENGKHRSKLLSSETNRRRKLLVERKKAFEQLEEERRSKILKERHEQQRQITERFQRAFSRKRRDFSFRSTRVKSAPSTSSNVRQNIINKLLVDRAISEQQNHLVQKHRKHIHELTTSAVLDEIVYGDFGPHRGGTGDATDVTTTHYRAKPPQEMPRPPESRNLRPFNNEAFLSIPQTTSHALQKRDSEDSLDNFVFRRSVSGTPTAVVAPIAVHADQQSDSSEESLKKIDRRSYTDSELMVSKSETVDEASSIPVVDPNPVQQTRATVGFVQHRQQSQPQSEFYLAQPHRPPSTNHDKPDTQPQPVSTVVVSEIEPSIRDQQPDHQAHSQHSGKVHSLFVTPAYSMTNRQLHVPTGQQAHPVIAFASKEIEPPKVSTTEPKVIIPTTTPSIPVSTTSNGERILVPRKPAGAPRQHSDTKKSYVTSDYLTFQQRRYQADEKKGNSTDKPTREIPKVESVEPAALKGILKSPQANLADDSTPSQGNRSAKNHTVRDSIELTKERQEFRRKKTVTFADHDGTTPIADFNTTLTRPSPPRKITPPATSVVTASILTRNNSNSVDHADKVTALAETIAKAEAHLSPLSRFASEDTGYHELEKYRVRPLSAKVTPKREFGAQRKRRVQSATPLRTGSTAKPKTIVYSAHSFYGQKKPAELDISLDKTPTDDDINRLWAEVRVARGRVPDLTDRQLKGSNSSAEFAMAEKAIDENSTDKELGDFIRKLKIAHSPKNAQIPSAMSIEEKRLMESLDKLDNRLWVLEQSPGRTVAVSRKK